MSTTSDESGTQRSGHKRLRLAIVVCVVAFCLAVFYVLLSAPLLLYSAHHPGGSAAEIVDVYMRPLLWVDEELTPEIETDPSSPGFSDEPVFVDPSSPLFFYRKPLHRRILFSYYGLWGEDVESQFVGLQFEQWVKSTFKMMEEETPFLGADGPGSPIL